MPFSMSNWPPVAIHLEENVRVTNDVRFDLDFVITSSDWRRAVLLEGGQAARLDLDLLKFAAYARASKWSGRRTRRLSFPTRGSFAALPVPKKRDHVRLRPAPVQA